MFITVFTVITQLIKKFKRTGHFFLSVPDRSNRTMHFSWGESIKKNSETYKKIENSWHSEIRLIIRVF